MASLQNSTNHTTSSNITTDHFEFQNFDLIQNYSVLINKLEKLALDVDATIGNISVDHKAVEVTLGNGELLSESIHRVGPPHATLGHGLKEVEYSRVVSDIWIGVILTLLIVCVIFFICACFLYHKFQQWKNSYRTNSNENVEICRNNLPNYEAESLPSYTIVSGLPTYDDAIEEFRKAGILLTPPMPVIKIFEVKETKDSMYSVDNNTNESDNISVASVNTCTCGAGLSNSTISNNNSTSQQFLAPQQVTAAPINTQFIELSPEQLSALSQKRLSLQIAFPPAMHRNSRARIDMRNNLLRSRAVSNTAGYDINFPQIHRSSSSFQLPNEPHNMQMMQQHLQHRGSLF